MAKQKVSIFIALWRVIKLSIHFGFGVIRLLLFARYYDEPKKTKLLQAWSKKLLQLLGIRLVLQGTVPSQLNNTLMVANHISWLDILVIFTVLKPHFVAKKEIGDWLILGKLTKMGGTVFIDRNRKRHIMQVNKQLSSTLKVGNCIAVFPEGTTSNGMAVQPFKASLFEPIYQSQGLVLPVALQYKDVANQLTTRPCFAGEITLLRSVWNVLSCYKLTVVVIFNELLNTRDYTDRNQLARVAQQEISVHW